MSRFENATPRPWYPYYAGPQDTHIIAGGGTIIKLLPVNGDKNQSQQEANAELIVTAVNAFDAFRAAAEPIIEALMHNEERLVRNYSKLGSDEEELVISQGQARALRDALKLNGRTRTR